MAAAAGPLCRIVLLAAVLGCADGEPPAARPDVRLAEGVELAVANDNRVAGGTRSDGGVAVRLETRTAGWLPDLDVDSAVTVQAFAEPGGPPRIPAPLLRAEQGTPISVSVSNTFPDSTLIVYGLRAGTVADDTVHVQPGEARVVTYTAGAPGTYLYWATTTGADFYARTRRDAQLTGAIVIDAAGAPADPDERIFVITVIDVLPDTTVSPPVLDDIWEIAINGLSWPHSERLAYAVGDTVRWRWLNGSYLSHPMHLHGFHFRTLAKGNGRADTTYAADRVADVVTEFMIGGSTFRMEWVPTRAGNWLMHCHMLFHITPFPPRPDSVRHGDGHDLARHPLEAMAGLVQGITTTERRGARRESSRPPDRHLRLLVQDRQADSAAVRGYVLERERPPAADSVEVPGPPLVLRRGETTAITVVNGLDEPTTIHWHGMELESVYDGVSGWSGAASNLAPLLAPGDSFTVAFTPPRAGTFIYHTHIDEGDQLLSGLYGPLLVLEPDETFDPATDRIFLLADLQVGGSAPGPSLNARREPPPLAFDAGTTYRLRFINIMGQLPADGALLEGETPVRWTPLSKDGAALPAARRTAGDARFRFGTGETYDFVWTPNAPAELTLEFRIPDTEPGVLRQTFRVR